MWNLQSIIRELRRILTCSWNLVRLVFPGKRKVVVLLGFSHNAQEPDSNLGELDAPLVHQEARLLSPKREDKRIPKGRILGVLPLEACKAYPIQIWKGLAVTPRIAYADLNSHGEQNQFFIKILPDGGKGAHHPQLVFFVNGPYHVETLGYTRSDPFAWTTWIECHLDLSQIENLKRILEK